MFAIGGLFVAPRCLALTARCGVFVDMFVIIHSYHQIRCLRSDNTAHQTPNHITPPTQRNPTQPCLTLQPQPQHLLRMQPLLLMMVLQQLQLQLLLQIPRVVEAQEVAQVRKAVMVQMVAAKKPLMATRY